MPRNTGVLFASTKSLATNSDGFVKGDTVSLQGQMKAELYTPAGKFEPRISLSIIANSVLALRQAAKGGRGHEL